MLWGKKWPGRDWTWQLGLNFYLKIFGIKSALPSHLLHPEAHWCVFCIRLSLSSSHQRSQRVPTNRSAGRHIGLGVTRSSALPGGCEGTVSCRTCLILVSRNLRRCSEHLNHPAEPSQLCLCFYDLASFFSVSMKTGQHQNLFQSGWRQQRVLRFKAV